MTVLGLYSQPLTAQYSLTFSRYDLSLSPESSQIPYVLRFYNKILWSTLLKAFLRSRNVAKLSCSWSIFSYLALQQASHKEHYNAQKPFVYKRKSTNYRVSQNKVGTFEN